MEQVPTAPADDGFEMVVRMGSGEVLMKMRGADELLVRGDIIPHLRQLAPLPPTHIYTLYVGEEILSGARTLADCGGKCPPGGTLEVVAALAESQFLAPMFEKQEAVLGLQQAPEFSDFVSGFPAEPIGAIMGTLCELWDIQPSRDLETGRGLLQQGDLLFALVRDFDPDVHPTRTVSILKPFCEDESLVALNVNNGSCCVISDWMSAVYVYSLSVL